MPKRKSGFVMERHSDIVATNCDGTTVISHCAGLGEKYLNSVISTYVKLIFPNPHNRASTVVPSQLVTIIQGRQIVTVNL
jgi:hypothetical protein